MLNRKLDDLQNNQEMKWKREGIAIGQGCEKCVCAIFPTLLLISGQFIACTPLDQIWQAE